MSHLIRNVCLLVMAVATITCQQNKTNSLIAKDIHSFANPLEIRVKHLHWEAKVDFEKKVIDATATWQVEGDGKKLVLDTKQLTIITVLVNGQPSTYALSPEVDTFGQALTIDVPVGVNQVSISYQTSSDSDALQWLLPQQTADKKFPVLFTQSEAILARSWVPCQDSPGVRFTYDADVIVPSNLMALMSASNPQSKNVSGQYHFEMKQPIPSYLLALVVGDFEFKAISQRSGVYAETSIAAAAAWEFADLEKMIKGAEELYGPYAWERYDVIVLPPSFPFGGMENPRLTFATPTIVAGDRSLTSLIAHELAHSWSGNLVTNATWNDFWLNEGFTVYFETRIMERLYGRDYAEMLASLNLQDLESEIKGMSAEGKGADTRLKLDLTGRNPDDGVTEIAYNKGYFFLRTIEESYGRDKFDMFLKAYFNDNAFGGMTTDAFITYSKEYYATNFNVNLPDTLYQSWIFSEGLPSSCPKPKSVLFAKVDKMLGEWIATGEFDKRATEKWSTHEWLHFLRNLPDGITDDQLIALDAIGQFTNSNNAEILTQWLVLGIRHNYSELDHKLEDFLVNTGRRKFLSPLYGELIKTPKGKLRAQMIYVKARPNYHFVATNTFDALLK